MKILAATYNPISDTKMVSFMLEVPTCLLAQFSQHRIVSQLHKADNEVDYCFYGQDVVNENKSANSARAIPHNKYLQKVLDNPFIPMWTANKSGMSGDMIINPNLQTAIWLSNLEKGDFTRPNGCNDTLLDTYQELITLGTHKQNANRLLAPFAYTTCIMSGTQWEEFINLRCPKYEFNNFGYNFISSSKKSFLYNLYKIVDKLEDSDSEILSEFNEYCKRFYTPNTKYSYEEVNELYDWQSINTSTAQPEIQALAEKMYDLYHEAIWKESKYHIPFLNIINEVYKVDILKMYGDTLEDAFRNDDYFKIAMKISASMCAKLSYNTQDNIDTLEKHLDRAKHLAESGHWEVFSHQAIAMDEYQYNLFKRTRLVNLQEPKIVEEFGKCNNLTGFIPQRYIYETQS